MKKFLLGCAAVIVSAGAAFAADMPSVYKAAPAAMFNWSGFYAGIHGGYGWGENKFVDDFNAISGKFKPSGGFGGVQIGYNSQFAPHWLIGGEFDFSAGDISDSIGPIAGLNGKDKIDYFGTARTRFGYVADRNLIYVTGGVAWMHDKTTLGPGMRLSASQYFVGWVLGAGWEYAIDDRWSAKIEYLYASFGRNTDFGGLTARTFDPSVSTLKLGVNYRFADLASAAQSMPVKAAAYRSGWNGGYLGVHGGYAWADYHALDPNFAPAQTWNLDPAGGFGGIQSGANIMISPNWLFGLETDASYGSLRDNGVSIPGAVPLGAKIDALGTLRGRFGYVMDSTLLYVTGGGAYGHEKSTLTSGGSAVTSKENLFGWTLGGGVEYKFAQEWSAKLEYLYMDLGKNRFDSTGEPRNTGITVSTMKVGINYYGPMIERLFAGR